MAPKSETKVPSVRQCRTAGVLFVAMTVTFVCLFLLYIFLSHSAFYAYSRVDPILDAAKGAIGENPNVKLVIDFLWSFKVQAQLLFVAGFVLEALCGVWICVLAARRKAPDEVSPRAVDAMPMYLLGSFSALIFILSLMYVYSRFERVGSLATLLRDPLWGSPDLTQSLSPEQWLALLAFLFVLIASAVVLYLLLTSVVIRLKSPDWWQRTLLYKLFVLGSMEQRARALLWFATLMEFALLTLVFFLLRGFGDPKNGAQSLSGMLSLGYILLDLAFVLIEVLYIYIIGRSVFALIRGTHRIVREKKGALNLDGLQDQSRIHAGNINILSRNANAQMEQRYINESFSIRLINNVSQGLRGPLRAVAENVRLLEAGGLSPQAEQESICRIGALSEDLKKTIEDLIRVSRASTGVIESDPVPTDVVEMMNQALGEYYERFEAKQMEPVLETPPLPLMIRADSEFMWNVFDGVLSVIEEDGVPGTRVCLSAKGSRAHVLVLFRATVRPPEEEKVDLSAENGLGLPFAKVYAELQGGDLYYKYGKDTLTVVLRFPAMLTVQEV